MQRGPMGYEPMAYAMWDAMCPAHMPIKLCARATDLPGFGELVGGLGPGSLLPPAEDPLVLLGVHIHQLPIWRLTGQWQPGCGHWHQ